MSSFSSRLLGTRSLRRYGPSARAANPVARAATAVAEGLENRRLMSATISIAGDAAVRVGTNYTLTVTRPESLNVGKWGVNWGDGPRQIINAGANASDANPQAAGVQQNLTHPYAENRRFTITVEALDTAGNPIGGGNTAGPSEGTLVSKLAVETVGVQFTAFAAQGADTYLAAGSDGVDFLIAKYNAVTGERDDQFGAGLGNGVVSVDDGYIRYPAPGGIVSAISVNGNSFAVVGTANDQLTVVYTKSGGTIDDLTGSEVTHDGVSLLPHSTTGDSVASDGMGGFYVGGSGTDGIFDHGQAVALHLKSDGTLDQGFGDANAFGAFVRTFEGDDVVKDIAFDGTDVALAINSHSTTASLAVLHPAATMTTRPGVALAESVQEVAFDWQGNILVSGHTSAGSIRHAVIALYDRSTLNPVVAFGQDAGHPEDVDGTTVLEASTDSVFLDLQVTSDPQHTILATGRFTMPERSGSDLLVARYTATGHLDTTFGEDDGAGGKKGYVVHDFGQSPQDVPWNTSGSVIVENGDLSVTVAGRASSEADENGVAFARFAPTTVTGTGEAVPSVSANVTAFSLSTAGGGLAVTATGVNDTITVSGTGNSLTLTVEGVGFGPFNVTGAVTIEGLAGNDDIRLLGVTRPAMVFGGPGNDLIVGGNGSGVLVGGDGLDAIAGGNGRDLLIGGNGSDALVGGNGEDVLVAGRTSYDANPVALSALRAMWQRTDLSFNQRVSNLSNGNGVTGGYALRTDGGNQTVFDDSAADTLSIDLLIGGGAADYFLYNYQQSGTPDIVLDMNGNDVRGDIDPT